MNCDLDDWRAPLVVGQELTTELTFTPESVRAFATQTNDTNPLHHDEQVASATRFGGLIASGTQTTALLMGSLANHVSANDASLGLSFNFQLKKAVSAQSVMTARWKVTAITPNKSLSGVIVTLQGGLFDERDVTAIEATATIAIMPRSALQRKPIK